MLPSGSPNPALKGPPLYLEEKEGRKEGNRKGRKEIEKEGRKLRTVGTFIKLDNDICAF